MTSDSLLHRPAFVGDLLVRALERHQDKPALFLGDVVLTGGQLRDRMSTFAQALDSLGIRQGSTTALLSPNRPEVLVALGAAMVSGCRNTPLSAMGSSDDHAYVLEDAEIETIVYDPNFDARVAELAERVPSLTNLLSLGPSEVGTDILALAETFQPQRLVAAEVEADDLSSLVYTGGTTGKPKGVMGAYRAGAALNQIQLSDWEWPEQPKFLMATPLSHAGAAFFIPTLMKGGALYVLPYFEPGAVLAAIEEHKIDATMLVPTMIYMLLDHPDLEKRDTSSLRTLFYGAAPMSPARLKEGIAKLGSVFFQYYGQTECGMTITVMRTDEHDVTDDARLASCGRPVPWLDVRLLDDDLNEVEPGEPGEICVRGPLVMKGYWNKPDETEEALRGGWLHTGDIARADRDGFLTIVDRKKDMIVTGGFNVFPREVEDVLSAHPSVAAAAVVGVPDDKWGEAVKAVVKLRDGADVDEAALTAELQESVKEAKGSVQAPKSIDYVDAIPLTPIGKLDKKAIRAQYWEGSTRSV